MAIGGGNAAKGANQHSIYTGRAAKAAGFSTGQPGVRGARGGQPNSCSVREISV